MYKTTKPLVALMVLLLALLPAQTPAREQDGKSIEGRLKLEVSEDCIKIHVFLTNKTNADISIVTGAGGVARSVVPSFFSGFTHLEAATWKSSPRRSMRPDALTLRPDEETLYDVYVVPYPSGDAIEGVIYFRALDRDYEYIARLGSQKLPVPTKKQDEDKQK